MMISSGTLFASEFLQLAGITAFKLTAWKWNSVIYIHSHLARGSLF